MNHVLRVAALFAGAASLALSRPAAAQHDHGPEPADHGMHAERGAHAMWRASLGRGWTLAGMGQVFPIVTWGAPRAADGDPIRSDGWYLTQPAVMANLASPGERVVLRTTLNLEAATLEEGELTFGGWGEGFIDKRHPHTLLHELMLSWNAWDAPAGSFSLSVGRGFAPYGTDDPMSRPGLKYPTNHHLSQILERWTVNGVWRTPEWSVEAGVFGGAEPEGPYDLSNIESFGDSWSARVARRMGEGSGPAAEWEISASYGNVLEEHDGESERTHLWNGAVRHAGPGLYTLVEASMSRPSAAEGYFSVLGEAMLERSAHRPYVRVEYARRPEYVREGAPSSPDFFRYHHGDAAVGATRWLISTAGYGFEATPDPWSLRPFVEIQHHRVRPDRGGIDPEVLLGSDSFWAVSLGVRVFIGGGPMRMGAYGALDPMSDMSRQMAMPGM